MLLHIRVRRHTPRRHRAVVRLHTVQHLPTIRQLRMDLRRRIVRLAAARPRPRILIRPAVPVPGHIRLPLAMQQQQAAAQPPGMRRRRAMPRQQIRARARLRVDEAVRPQRVGMSTALLRAELFRSRVGGRLASVQMDRFARSTAMACRSATACGDPEQSSASIMARRS